MPPSYPSGVEKIPKEGGTGRSSLWADAALATAVTTVVAVAISADSPTIGDDPRHLDWYAYLFAAGLGALMFARRSYPVGVLLATALGTVAYYICQYPPIGLAIPMGAALYVAAQAGHVRWAVAAAGAVLGLSLFFRIQQGEQVRYLLLYDTLLTVSVMAGALGFGAARRATQRWRTEASERTRQAAVLVEHEARERLAVERSRMARDLHDSLGHTISVIAVQADVAAESATELPPETVEALSTITSASRRAMAELRSAVGILRTPEPSAPTPTLDDLNGLVDEVTDGGLTVTLSTTGDLTAVPPFVAAAAFRIVQESLTNAIRHGLGRAATVSLDVGASVLEVRVHNDAVARAPAPPAEPGHGIRGMSERALLLDGSLEAGPDPQGGWSVRASLPVAPQ